MKIIFLGTGTSQGIPVIGCNCRTCTSSDTKNIRLRPSIFIEVDGTNILIDSSNDFRMQMLKHNIRKLDGVLLTHHHFDHISGIDDIRMYNYIQKTPVNFYSGKTTLDEVQITFRYAFNPSIAKGGGLPQLVLNPINETPFCINGIEVQPLKVFHGSLEILGFRIRNLVYITDASKIPEETFDYLKNVDTLILNALRYRTHPTHFNLEQSITIAERINAKETWFTHICHDLEHNEVNSTLKESMKLAHDGLELYL